ncbi:MAG: hypothetical protein HDT19_04035 [Oscillibacter sp.]|nr:hypothetical protein [Oscillibacter sp.]
MELAVQQKHQQICWRRDQLSDFSGVQHETAYQTVKELHETYHWLVYKLCIAAGISRAGYPISQASTTPSDPTLITRACLPIMLNFLSSTFLLVLFIGYGPLICMEHNTFGNDPQPYSIPQGANCQETVDFASNPTDDYLSSIGSQMAQL